MGNFVDIPECVT